MTAAGILGLLALAAPPPSSTPPPAAPPLHFGTVLPGRLYHGALPVTPAEYDFVLGTLGVRTVVSLEGEWAFRYDLVRERAELERRSTIAHPVRLLNLPLGTGEPRDADLDRVLEALADPAKQPVYFHCHLGADRTQLVNGLFRVRWLGQPFGAVRRLMSTNDFMGEAGGDSAAIRRHTCAALGRYWDRHAGAPRVHPGFEGHAHDLDGASARARARSGDTP